MKHWIYLKALRQDMREYRKGKPPPQLYHHHLQRQVDGPAQKWSNLVQLFKIFLATNHKPLLWQFFPWHRREGQLICICKHLQTIHFCDRLLLVMLYLNYYKSSLQPGSIKLILKTLVTCSSQYLQWKFILNLLSHQILHKYQLICPLHRQLVTQKSFFQQTFEGLQ